ncbi:MAG: metal ABC transporter permease [Bdellovibrio sp.]|nr:metal ABC transporter permease [Bdellovibrio sp.]
MNSEYFQLFAIPIFAVLVMAGLCGLLGPFVLLKRLAFLTDTIAHACIFGIALGISLQIAPYWTLLPFAAFLGWILSRASRHSGEGLSNLTAVAFSLFLGLGTLILSYRGIAGQEMVHILFGDVLWIRSRDLLLLLFAVLIIVPFFVFKFKAVTLALVSRDLALTSGIHVDKLNDLFLVLVAVVLALCTKIVGVLLVSSLVVLPAFLASSFSHSFRQQLLLSISIAIGGSLVGLALSFSKDLPIGPSISSVLGTALLIANFAQVISKKIRSLT